MALKNICLVTHGNFEDSNTWSGTPRILSSQLRKRGFLVWGIDVSKISILFLRIINAVYVRLGFFQYLLIVDQYCTVLFIRIFLDF